MNRIPDIPTDSWVRRGVDRGAAFWNRGGILRLVVSAALFGLLFWKMDAGALLRDWREILLGPFILALLLLEASNLVGCVQWQTLLRAQGLRPRWSLVFGSYHVALFFSNFLPGHYGGDAVRVYDVYRETGEGYHTLAATFLDRVLGLVSLCLLAVAVAPAFLGQEERGALGALLVIVVVLAVMLILLFSRRAARSFRFILRPFDRLGVGERVRAGYDAVYLYRERVPALAGALVLSLLVQALRVLVHYETALALGVEARMRDFFLLVPLVAIFIALPISINGIGVREGAGIILFGQLGVESEGAFGLLFLAYLAGVVVSLSGGVVFALRGRKGRDLGTLPPGETRGGVSHVAGRGDPGD
jgi:uncharacterized protein (TIRG00374 family)